MGSNHADTVGTTSPPAGIHVEVDRVVPAAPASCHWGMLLVPSGPGGGQPLPDDALQVYAHLTWRAALDELRGQTLRVTTARRWVSVGPSNTEVADQVTAHHRDDEVASALLVSRTATGVPEAPFGVRALPSAPPATAEVAYGDVVVERSRVTTFATTSGITHSLHLDAEACRLAGFDDLVVQGLELLDDVVRAAGATTRGVSAWFRRAVVAGERVRLSAADDRVWVVSVADGSAAIVAQVDTGASDDEVPQ